MGYYKAQIDKNRREELKIIQRGGLEELAESYPGDSRLLTVVHGLEGYERKNIRTAVLECTDGESNQSTRYYKALARLIDIQVKMPDAEEWLPKKYDTPEKAAKEFKRLGKKSKGYLSKVIEYRLLDLYFALRYHGIKTANPDYKHRRKWDRYKMVGRRVEHFLANELLKDDGGLDTAERKYWSCDSAGAVQDWLFIYVDKGRMPGVKQAIEVPGLQRVINEYGSYAQLKDAWEPFFRKTGSGLSKLDVARIRAYMADVPKRYLYNTDIKDLRAMTGMFEDIGSRSKSNINKVFINAEPCDVGKAVRACKADVPYNLIARAPVSVLEDLTALYAKHTSREDRKIFWRAFHPSNFEEVYSKDISKLKGIIQALLLPWNLLRSGKRVRRKGLREEHIVRARAYMAGVPGRFLFDISTEDLKGMTDLYKTRSESDLRRTFADFMSCDVGKAVRACKAGVPHGLVRRAPISALEDLARLHEEHPEDKLIFGSMFSPTNFREVYSKDSSKLDDFIRALLMPWNLPRDGTRELTYEDAKAYVLKQIDFFKEREEERRLKRERGYVRHVEQQPIKPELGVEGEEPRRLSPLQAVRRLQEKRKFESKEEPGPTDDDSTEMKGKARA